MKLGEIVLKDEEVVSRKKDYVDRFVWLISTYNTEIKTHETIDS